jgi:hypothetical protein
MSEKEKPGSAFNLFEIAILILIAGFIAAVAIPNYVGSPRSGPGWNANYCINNLRQIDGAANQFALESHLTNGNRINFPNDLTPYIKLNREGKISGCPSGGTYHIGRVGKAPTCSLGTSVTPAHVSP